MAESEPQQTNRIAEMADQAIRYFQDDAQHGGRIILRAELERKFIEVAEAAVEDAREPSLYREAIEATARCFDAPPDVLATLAKDGSFLEWAIISAEAYMKIIPHDARPPNYHEWMQKVEELRTAGETMGEKRNETERER